MFVEGVIWGIDSFDQWGVELGKKLATKLVALVANGAGYEGTNPSTAALVAHIRKLRSAG